MKIVLSLIVFAFLFALPTFAAVRCETQYGGGEVCVKTGELQIDKKVWNPSTSLLVDNLGLYDHVFKAGEEVVFKIRVKNVGDETFASVNVWDTLPSYLYLTSGTLNYTINDLTPGEVDEREIKVKVVSAEKLPNQSSICPVNTASAQSGNEKDTDTAQVCISNKVLAVVTGKGKGIPKTGPEMLLVGLLPVMGGAGLYLKMKTKKSD